MKTFNDLGIEKDDNADVIVELEAVQTVIGETNALLRTAKSDRARLIAQARITNVHLGVLTDQYIEEPP